MSLINQNYPNFELLTRDQSPNREAYKYIKKKLPKIFDRLNIEKGENLLHSGGHNKLINKMKGDYYLCCSQDMWYPPNFITNIIKELEKTECKKYGSATCKLMKWNFPLYNHDHPEVSKSNQIDSCGLGIKKNHHFYDIGQGETDEGQYNDNVNIFGASGALAIYRKEALDSIAYNQEFFDELIHYKNDIDLAYRLQWAGWPCLFIPEVKVYHDRLATLPNSSKNRLIRMIKARKAKSKWIKSNSFFGQQVIILKHFSKKFSLSVKLKTTIYQWITLFYTMIFEPYLLKQSRVLKKKEKEIFAKRDAIVRKVKPGAIERLMN